MNKNTVLVGGLLGILIIGGVIVYSVNKSTSTSDSATTTAQTITTTTTNQVRNPGLPILVTNSKVAPTDTTVVVTGTVTPNGAFTNYWYEYGATIDLDKKTSTQSVGSGYSSIPAPGYITGLVKDTVYYFRLVAENQYGKVSGVQYSFRTTLNVPAPVGSVPSTKTLSANEISRTTANLRGEIIPNKAETEYWFEYGETSELGNTSALVALGNGSTKLSANLALSDLSPFTTYYFRINAQNQFGTVNGSTLNFKTSGPAAATAPVATTRSAVNINTLGATLRATISPNGAETTYWFEYNINPSFSSTSMQTTERLSAGTGTNAKALDVVVINLNATTTYYFRIVAENSIGTVRGSDLTFKTK